MILVDFTACREKLQLKVEAGKKYVFDAVRKKWIVATPEELVRQLVLLYLIHEKHFHKKYLKVEHGLTVNLLYKRCDILAFGKNTRPFLLAEIKAPGVLINDAVFRQIAAYNLPLQVQYLLVTNGLQTYCCQMDYNKQTYTFLPEIPSASISKP